MICSMAIFVAVAVAAALAQPLAWPAGPTQNPTRKEKAYECGGPPTSPSPAGSRSSFCSIAMLFVVFDVEAASFFPWAVKLKELGAFGLVEMLTFIAVLGIGYAYVWKKGGFSWK